MGKLFLFDKLLLLGVVLIVVGMFTIAYFLKINGGQCVLNPCNYASLKNISCFVPAYSP